MDPKTPAAARKVSAPVRQFGIYLAIGLFALVLDVLVFWSCRSIGFELWLANPIARLAGAALAFLLHHRVTFKQRADGPTWGSSSWRYVVLWMGATVVATGCISLLMWVGLEEIFSKILVEGAMPIVSFLLARHWVFRSPRKSLE